MNERRTFLASVAAFFVGLLLGQQEKPPAVIRWYRIQPPVSQHAYRYTVTYVRIKPPDGRRLHRTGKRIVGLKQKHQGDI